MAASAARLAAGDQPTRASSSTRCALRSARTEVFVFTPKGDVIALLPARPRSTSPTPCTPRWATARSAPGSTAGWCRWTRCWRTVTSIEVITSKAEGAGPSQDWLDFVKSAAGPQQDPCLVLQGTTRRGDRARQGRHRARDAQAGAADAADHERSSSAVGRRRPATEGHHCAVCRGRRGPRQCTDRRAAARRVLGGEEGATEDIAEATVATKPARVRTGGDPGVVGQGRRRRVGQAGPLLHPGAGRHDRRLRHAGQRRLGAPQQTASTSRRWRQTGSSTSSGRRQRPASSWCRSRSRRSTGRGCSPTSRGCCPTST